MHVTPRKFEDLFIESSKSRKHDFLLKSVLSQNTHTHIHIHAHTSHRALCVFAIQYVGECNDDVF